MPPSLRRKFRDFFGNIPLISRINLTEYILLAVSSLFVIVDPLAAVPSFLTMTATDSPEHRIRMARIACCVTAGVLLVFAAAGSLVFKIFGITMPAFQVAASIILLIVALDMVRAQRSRVHETSEETQAGAEKSDIAVTPLAIPMMAGPGAISTTILLQNEAHGFTQHAVLYGCILLVVFSCYLVLRLAATGAKWLNPIFMSITTRIMGLILAAIAIQFMLNAANDVRLEWFHAPLTQTQ